MTSEFGRSGDRCPRFRTWEVVWEVNGLLFYTTVRLRSHIVAPEAAAKAANVPEGAPCCVIPHISG